VGTASDPQQQALRLVIRGPDDRIRQLRSLPLDRTPWFGNVTVAGGVVAWVEGSATDPPSLWAADLDDGPPPRQLSADIGVLTRDGAPSDLVVANGRLSWATRPPDERDVTEIRSVPLTGGQPEMRTVAGNMLTGQDARVPRLDRSVTRCGPAWCQLTSYSGGAYHVDVIRPDGSDRASVATGTALPAVADVVPLDRFVVLSADDAYAGLTGTRHLLVFELTTRRTVDVSAGVRTVSYDNGVLWWSTGTQAQPVWHAIDLRTV
jgi:hypothetical protein